jgi:hypothetical protein
LLILSTVLCNLETLAASLADDPIVFVDVGENGVGVERPNFEQDAEVFGLI